MSAAEPASLTSALLTRKGRAAPTLPTRGGIAEEDERRGVLARLFRRELASDTTHGPDEAPNRASSRRRRDERVRVTLRLDDAQHLRLRLTAAHQNSTMQHVMIAALDRYVVECRQVLMGGTCACLEGQKGPTPCGLELSNKE